MAEKSGLAMQKDSDHWLDKRALNLMAEKYRKIFT